MSTLLEEHHPEKTTQQKQMGPNISSSASDSRKKQLQTQNIMLVPLCRRLRNPSGNKQRTSVRSDEPVGREPRLLRPDTLMRAGVPVTGSCKRGSETRWLVSHGSAEGVRDEYEHSSSTPQVSVSTFSSAGFVSPPLLLQRKDSTCPFLFQPQSVRLSFSFLSCFYLCFHVVCSYLCLWWKCDWPDRPFKIQTKIALTLQRKIPDWKAKSWNRNHVNRWKGMFIDTIDLFSDLTQEFSNDENSGKDMSQMCSTTGRREHLVPERKQRQSHSFRSNVSQ